ncbi:hypothetical protein PTSG_09462 [Salpingoeca rosetta]|uniref:Uncharacterized protein n=1 Tax=Salpingoeca rosetta (strain ATCC 50818 / BSB-021) TaxID=946362 RepID=F2UMP5_SALR5|nr:uncharacterized protein PTSG_09462 [Salpingoeca rosetta]EGD78394.1 hypothetical protein PTSG_09462 [Salpingoeca rosetta]|eukprot:XP_004989717.1 hypothetical protein PTSG_09462 [Salpingoeca rosetta]
MAAAPIPPITSSKNSTTVRYNASECSVDPVSSDSSALKATPLQVFLIILACVLAGVFVAVGFSWAFARTNSARQARDEEFRAAGDEMRRRIARVRREARRGAGAPGDGDGDGGDGDDSGDEEHGGDAGDGDEVVADVRAGGMAMAMAVRHRVRIAQQNDDHDDHILTLSVSLIPLAVFSRYPLNWKLCAFWLERAFGAERCLFVQQHCISLHCIC